MSGYRPEFEAALRLFALHPDADLDYLSAGSDLKAWAIMASRTSRPNKPIPLAEFVADIERRRQATGITELPRNSGARRTPSKYALLKAIEETGGKW